MLVALLENNNNTRLLPGFKIDPRSSAGRSRHSSIDGSVGAGETRGQGYDLSDIVAAAASFPEIAGEDPAIRAIRRLRWVSEALPFIKEAREKREAAVFLAGAHLGAAAERAEREAQEAILIQTIDELRAAPVLAPQVSKAPAKDPAPRERGGGSSLPVIAIGLVLGGVVIGSLISSARRSRRSSGSSGRRRVI